MSSDRLVLRLATASDSESYWQINNHPTVRKVSLSSQSIPWDIHVHWFTASLENPERTLFVVTLSAKIVAVSRMDLKGECAEISLAVAPEHHGCGIGSWTIVQTGKTLLRARPQLSYVRALIKSDNLASQKVFEKAGYIRVFEVCLNGAPVWEYQLLAQGRDDI